MSKTVQPDGGGFTAGEQTTVNVEDLNPHPKNQGTYVHQDNSGLRASIKRHGFRDEGRLLVCEDGTILSGHRRWMVAKNLGIEQIPIEVTDIDPDSREAEIVILTENEYRDKTPAEKVNEAEWWVDLLKDEDDVAGGQDLVTDTEGRVDEIAAEQVGFSRESFRQGKRVKELSREGDDVAAAEWAKMETGDQSIHGAYKAVKKSVTDDEDGEDNADDDPDEADTSSEDESPDGGDGEATADESTEDSDGGGDSGNDDGGGDGVEEMDYPDEIRQWTLDSKSTGTTYLAKADVEVYGLVQVVLEELDDGWQVYVDGPGQTERVVVCGGEDYTPAVDAMMGYLDDTTPDEARETIDTEETRPDNGWEPPSDDTDSSSGQRPSADDAGGDDASDAGSEETVDEAAAAAEPPVDKATADAISRQHELEAENERLRRRLENTQAASATLATTVLELQDRIAHLREGSKRQAERIDEYREQALSAKMDAPDEDAIEQAKAHVDVAVGAVPETPVEEQRLTDEDLNDRVSKVALQLEDAQSKLEAQL